MASTFTLKSHSYEGRYLELYCVQVPDITNNQSVINWTLSSKGGEVNNYTTGPTTVTIAGSQVYYCKKMEWDTYQFPAVKGSVSGSITVPHDTYGNLTIPVGLSTNIYTGVIKSFSGNWTLDSIPRQAIITEAYDFTDVENPSISFTNPGGYPMDAWLGPNQAGEHFCMRENIPNTGSYTWTLTGEERNALRNQCERNFCSIRIVLRSFVGGVEYANYRDVTYTMTENDSTTPDVRLSVSPNNGSLPGTFDGLYIQGKSRVSVSVTASGKFHAQIISYSGNVEGKHYNNADFTSDALQNSGEVSVYGYAADSRGFTGANVQRIQAIEYEKPLVIPITGENAVSCYRSDGNGKKTGYSTSVWVKAARHYRKVISSGEQKNFCALQWRRKLSTEEWNDSAHLWDDLMAKDNLAGDQYSGLIPEVVFDLQKSYTVQIRAIDDLGEHDLKTLEVPTRDVALHLGKGGKNVTIGAYCDYDEDYTFTSHWKSIFRKGMIGTLLNQNVTDVLAFAEKCMDGLTPFSVSASANNASLPEGSGGYSSGIVHKRAADQYNVLLMDHTSGRIAVNVHLNGTWTGWKYFTPQ